MNFALIIQGTSASGKTTVGRKIAINKRACYLEYDYFIFAIQPYRPEAKEHFDLGNVHMWRCFKNLVEAKKDVVIEGALVSHDKSINDFDLQMYISFLEEHHYKILRIMLVSSFEAAEKRMTPREVWEGHTSFVSKDLYLKLKAELEKTVPSFVSRVDTTNMSTEDAIFQVEKLVFTDSNNFEF